jgi:hypothetical protein
MQKGGLNLGGAGNRGWPWPHWGRIQFTSTSIKHSSGIVYLSWINIYQMSVEALLTVSKEAVSELEIEADLGLIEVGSQARKVSRAVLRTLHQCKRSSRVSAIKRWRMVVQPCFLSYKWSNVCKNKTKRKIIASLYLKHPKHNPKLSAK